MAVLIQKRMSSNSRGLAVEPLLAVVFPLLGGPTLGEARRRQRWPGVDRGRRLLKGRLEEVVRRRALRSLSLNALLSLGEEVAVEGRRHLVPNVGGWC